MTEVMANMRAIGVLDALRQARKIVEGEPGISGGALLKRLEHIEHEASERLAQFDEASRPARTQCTKCNQPIEKSTITGDQWVHSSDGSRGCRAATYVEGQGWDNDIPRTWTATAPKAAR